MKDLPRRQSRFRRLVRRRPQHGTVILVLPTAWLGLWISRCLIGLAVGVYVSNFLLAELVVQSRFANIDLLREFPVTSWGLYADLAPDEVVNSRLHFELKSPEESVAFDDYVRRYPTFLPGAFHARTAVMLGRGREFPVRMLLRFLVDRYCTERGASCAPDGSRPDVVTVRQSALYVKRGRLLTGVEPDKLTEIRLYPDER